MVYEISAYLIRIRQLERALQSATAALQALAKPEAYCQMQALIDQFNALLDDEQLPEATAFPRQQCSTPGLPPGPHPCDVADIDGNWGVA